MSKWKLNRRTLLRSGLAASTLGIALPTLDIFCNSNGTAYASESSYPLRFALFYWGNGMIPSKWTPTGTGTEWQLSEQLLPLADVKDNISVVTGMEVKIPNNLAHGSGAAGFLSGQPPIILGSDEFSMAVPSFDQVLAAEIGGDTIYRSLEVGVQPDAHGNSYNGPNSMNPPECDPIILFDRIFGDGFREPGEEATVDPKWALRRSVLDFVMDDAARLRGRLGTTDKQRLDQHLDAIRDLELRIARLESDPPNYAACSRPERPAEIPDIEGRPQMSERSKVITDLVTMAMACDLTRVLSYWYSDPLNNVLYPEATAGHHQLTHDEPGEQPQINQIIKSIMSDFGYFISSLRSVPEGDGTLLDNSVVVASSEVSDGKTHQIDEIPIILAGTAGGKLKTGIHYRSSTKENSSLVPFSVIRAMGVPVGEFGAEEGLVTEGLSEIEV